MADTDVIDVHQAMAGLSAQGHGFADVLRAPSGSLSVTVARWPSGSADDQTPHAEDEVYHVTAGEATLTVADRAFPVRPGSVAFVAAGVEHRFTDIRSDLEVVVFWSPARVRDSGS